MEGVLGDPAGVMLVSTLVRVIGTHSSYEFMNSTIILMLYVGAGKCCLRTATEITPVLLAMGRCSLNFFGANTAIQASDCVSLLITRYKGPT